MLGASFGIVVNRLFPGLPAPPGAYALVGMAAAFAASAHAPISAVIILFELTGDYRIILPLMLTVVVATLLSRWWLKGESIYTLKLTRRGVRLERGRDVDVMQGVTVNEVMTRNVDAVPASMTLSDLSEAFARTRHHGFPVLDDEGKLWGMVTLQDMERAVARHLPDETIVTEIGTQAMIVAYPDEPMGEALSRLSARGVGRLPVVSRGDPRHLLGLVRRYDIVRAYNVALTRRAEIQHRAKHMQLRNLDNTEFVEIELKEGGPAVGKTLNEIARLLPDDCVLISIRRGDRLLIPHGDTGFEAGDRITAFATTEAIESLHYCLHTQPQKTTHP
jgi:CIC family chloride channel protein